MFKIAIFHLLIVFCIFGYSSCWDSQEMQMFDLVEELKENFYDYLGLTQNATVGEIGKAYRKLSLRYHPDKNPGVENANKFRHLVTIYEILKDEQMRERYHEVLKFGLPDWRMPSFYYRKLRKMQIFEIITLFSVLATLIHYACLWGVYFEKKLDMEEYLQKIFRRRRAQDRKKGKGNADNEITETLNTIPKPKWKDILPLVIITFTYYLIVSTPQNVKHMFNILKNEASTKIDKQFEKQRKIKEKEDEKKRLDEMKKQKKERKIAMSKEQSESRKQYEIAKQKAMVLPIETFLDLPKDVKEAKNVEEESVPLGPWSDENTILLIKALTKFPSGVNDRWIKISEMVKRPVPEVTSKIKEIQQKSKEGKIPIQQKMQSSLGDGVADQIEQNIYEQKGLFIPNILYHQDSPSSENETDEEVNTKSKAQLKKERKQLTKIVPIAKPADQFDSLPEDNSKEIINTEEDCNTQLRKKPRKKTSYLESDPISDVDCLWSQIEQKQLEEAIRTFPNGTSNRWDRIVQKIPTKTKAQCIERIKKLSQAVQMKQTVDS